MSTIEDMNGTVSSIMAKCRKLREQLGHSPDDDLPDHICPDCLAPMEVVTAPDGFISFRCVEVGCGLEQSRDCPYDWDCEQYHEKC